MFDDKRTRSSDKRAVYIETTFPNGKSYCGSGFIFAQKAVMTAAHLIYHKYEGGFARSATVYPEGPGTKGYFVTNFEYNSEIVGTDNKKDENWNWDNDWAILTTSGNIGDDYGYFGFGTGISKNDTLTITGFPGDKKGVRYTESGKATQINSKTIYHKISTTSGSSGSVTSIGDIAVGIHVASNSYYNISTRIDDFVYNCMMEYRHHYHVKYNANGGKGSMDPTVVEYGIISYLRKNTFTNNNYKFAGWYVHRKSDNKWVYRNANDTDSGWYKEGSQPSGWVKALYTDGCKVSETSSVNDDTITLYAQWQYFTVKYYPEGGSGSMADTKVHYDVLTTLRPNTFQKAGRHFTGWTAKRRSDNKWCYRNPDDTKDGWYLEGKQPSGWVKDVYKNQNNIYRTSSVHEDIVEMHAQWDSPSTFTFQYNANGGTGSMDPTVVTYGVTSYLRKNTFTNNNYKFAGWYLYKKSNDTWRYQNADNSKAGFYKEGSQPSGWVKSLYTNGCAVSKTSDIDSDVITLYAQWQYFTVKYYPEGGSGSMDDTKVYYDVGATLRKNTFQKAGRHFTGWTAKRRSSNKWAYNYADNTAAGWHEEGKQPAGAVKGIYKDQNNIYWTSTVHEDIVEMHATWDAPSTFTFQYNANGGTGSMDPTVVTYGITSYLRKNTFTKNNCKFVGWYLHRKSDNKWRYRNTDKTDSGWYIEGEQPSGWNKYIYPDGFDVAKTSSVDNDIVTLYAVWEADNSFEWGRDNWNFNNSSWQGYFKDSTYRDQIDKTYQDILKDNLTNSEYQTIFTGYWYYDKWYNAWLDDWWGGSCYGMTSLALLSKEGLLPYSSYKSSATKLHDLDCPKLDSNISSLVTYYQMLQVKDVIQQQFRTVKYRSNETNIKSIIELLKKNNTVLLGFRKDGWGGHAILATGYEYGSWTWNGVAYQGCIKTCDPNCSISYNDSYNIYFDTQSYNWTIPAYSGMKSVNGAVFNYIGSNVNEINNGGYLSGTSNNKTDNYIARIDAVAISDNRTVTKVIENNGEYVTQNYAQNDIIEDYSYVLGNESEGTIGYDLFDGKASYKVSQDNAQELQLIMNCENCYLSGGSRAGSSVIFNKNGYIQVNGENADYNMAMTFDDSYPTDWFTLAVSGKTANSASLSMIEDGYILSSDNLKNVCVHANNKEISACVSFSTDYNSILIYEIDEHTIGLKVDTDGNGTYETELTADTILVSTDKNTDGLKGNEANETELTEKTHEIGDVNLDGAIDIKDVTAIQKYLVGFDTLTDEQLAVADVNCDGKVNIGDATHLQMYLAYLIDGLG